MSRFSGKCDLCDHIFGMGGYFDKNGNKVNFGDKSVSCYYSDELLDFEAFKKQTNGKIYQYHKIKVTNYNKDEIKEYCSNFDYEEKTDKNNKKNIIYTYYGKQYSLKELNKKGVFIETAIEFNTLLDIIQYYPYIVCRAASSKNEAGDCVEHVVISNNSYVDDTFTDFLDIGYTFKMYEYYKKELQQHYLEVCKNYFLDNYKERIREIDIITYKPLHNGYYELLLSEPADYMHPVDFVWTDGKSKLHYSSPRLENSYTVYISEKDIEYYLAEDIKSNKVKLKYVAKNFNIKRVLS